MRTSISDLGHVAVGLCLDDIHPFLTSSVKRIKYAIKAAKMGRTNIPKDFLQLGADSERVIRVKNSRQRKCSIIWLEDPIPQSLHNSLLQGIFGFRSGMQGLHEELGRHRGREGRKECLLCGNDCESVSHVLWECPAYSSSCRSDFMTRLQEFLGEGVQHFESLDSQRKASFVLGSELWEEDFSSLLELVKGYVLSIWELRKAKLYENPNVQSSPSQSSSGVLPGVTAGLRR